MLKQKRKNRTVLFFFFIEKVFILSSATNHSISKYVPDETQNSAIPNLKTLFRYLPPPRPRWYQRGHWSWADRVAPITVIRRLRRRYNFPGATNRPRPPSNTARRQSSTWPPAFAKKKQFGAKSNDSFVVNYSFIVFEQLKKGIHLL